MSLDDFRRLAGLTDERRLTEAATDWTTRAAYHAREVQNITAKLKYATTSPAAGGLSTASKLHLQKELAKHQVALAAAQAGKDPSKSDLAAATKAIEPVGAGSPPDDVRSALYNRKTKTAGVLKQTEFEPNMVVFEPQYRERLDHFGNDGEGWDQEGWEEKYAGPLAKEVEAMLIAHGVKGWAVDIGEKGHVYVQLPKKGKAP